eukprot:1965172-Rhodomonas_salina.3
MGPDDALFCPTNLAAGGFRRPTASGFRATGSLAAALKVLFEDCRSNTALLTWFSWHSLRRGGASWAFRNRVPLDAVMRHGVWHSAGGIKQYISVDLASRCEPPSRLTRCLTR